MKQYPAWLLAAVLAMVVGAPSTTMASTVETAGDVLFVLVPLAGIATATVKHDRDGQVQFIKAFATNAAVTGGLKALIDKRRPDGSCCDSFPSAHASFTFMGAAFLQRRYGRKYAIPAYTAATFVAYSRVFADKHFIEDVVAGAAIGYVSSYLFTTEYRGVTLAPVAGRESIGITFAGSW